MSRRFWKFLKHTCENENKTANANLRIYNTLDIILYKLFWMWFNENEFEKSIGLLFNCIFNQSSNKSSTKITKKNVLSQFLVIFIIYFTLFNTSIFTKVVEK